MPNVSFIRCWYHNVSDIYKDIFRKKLILNSWAFRHFSTWCTD